MLIPFARFPCLDPFGAWNCGWRFAVSMVVVVGDDRGSGCYPF